MKKIYIIILLLFLASPLLFSQTVLFTESFETDGEGVRYTSTTYNECTPGGNPDYFLRTNTNPVLPPGSCATGFGSTLTNLQGSFFWAGEDIRSNGCPAPGCYGPGTITTQSINIAGYTSLSFSMYLATGSNNNVRWESNDSINLKASINGGPFVTFGRFVGDAPAGGRLRIDANLDGIGEGTAVDQDAFAQHTFSIPGTGSTLQVRLEYYQFGGTEESAADLLQVSGNFTGGPEINVQGNSVNILDGDITPTSTDHTDFGNISVCTGTLDRTFTIQNTGTSSLTISSVTITGAASADYTVITPPSGSVSAGGNTSMVIRFNPSASGPRNATININSNDADEALYDFSITGTGVDPEINVQGNSTSIVDGDVTPSLTDHTDFGSQSVCSGTIVRTFTIQNTGTSNLSVSSVNITGTHAADYTLTAIPANPVTAGNSTTFQITFNPSASGIRTATINISNGDCDEATYDFAIQGTGTDPEINVQSGPTTIVDGDATPSIIEGTDFGGLSVCSGTIPSNLTIYNTGNSNLSITNIIVTGGDFVLSGIPLPATIAPGANANFTITFNPSNLGPINGTVSIFNNDCNESTYDFTITGMGQDPEMIVQGNSSNIADGDITPSLADHTDFGNQTACSGTITRTYTIQNMGFGTPLDINAGGITITGVNAADFSIGGITLPTSIPAFSAINFTVTFNPSATGLRTATINISNNDCDEGIYDFAIQGTGTDPEINVQGNSTTIVDGDATPTTTDFTDFGIQSVCAGTLNRTFTIQNTGTAVLNITSVTITGANAADYSVITPPSSTVAAAGSTTFTIAFNPTANGFRNATININNDDCNEATYDFSISGFGNDPEINISGNGNNIVNGDLTPSTTDFTDFGNINVCSGSITKTYNYENLGNAFLVLSNFTITGPNAADFSILASPPLAISGSSFTIFTLGFDPSASGLRTATVNIFTNDCDEAVYSFSIQGTGDPDLTPPTAFCQNATLNLDAFGNATLLATQINNGSTDACGIASITVSPNSFTCANLGTNTVTLTVTDLGGNASTCNATVTINDVTTPTAICQNATIYLDNTGNATLAASAINNGSTDACGIASLSVSPSNFTCSNTGNNSVTLTVTDASGNFSTCIASVNVLDTVFPVLLNVPTDIYINASASSCSTPVSWTVPTLIDNCAGAFIGSSHNPGDIFPVGTTSVGYIAIDASGNMGGGGFNVIVTDSTAPMPDVITLPTITAECNASITIPPTATDNCSGSITGTTTDPLTYNSQGTYTVTWNYSDVNGNISSQTQTVIINDITSPTISNIPADITVNADPGNCSTAVSWTAPTASDNCFLQSFTANANSGDLFNAGINTVTYVALDNAGNSDSISFTITVIDTEAPTFTSCPSNISGCENEIISYTAPTGTDNCSSPVLNYSGLGSGVTYPVGVTTNTYILNDVSGNADTCIFTVTIVAAPTVSLNLPADSVCINAGAITLSGSPAGGTFAGPGVTGNTFDPIVAGLGSHNISYTFVDGNGCYNTDDQFILVLGCSGIEKLTNEINVIVYPNPVEDYLNIKSERSINKISLYDISGKVIKIYNNPGNDLTLLDFINLASGTYLLELTMEQEINRTRVIKK